MIAAALPNSTPLTFTLHDATLVRLAKAYGLTAKEMARAAAGAVNDEARRGRNQIRKRIRAYVTLPAKSVNPRIELTKKASNADPTAIVSLDRQSRDGGGSGNARPTLMSYRGKPALPQREGKRTKRGKLTKAARATFSYQILKQGGRKTLPGGFVQRPTRRFNLQSKAIESISGEGQQKAQAFRRKGRGRYPLVVPRGPSISAIWQSQQNPISEEFARDMRGRLPKRMRGRSQAILARNFRKVS